MTAIGDLLMPQAVLAGVSAANKKTLFQQLSQAAERAYGLDARAVIEQLSAREKLGSTGFGGGIAIPHGKIDGLKHVVGDNLAGESAGNIMNQAMGYVTGVLASLWAKGQTLISIFSLLIITPVVAFYLSSDWDRIIATVD